MASIKGGDSITMSKRKHPEGEHLRQAGVQENGNARKRRKGKDDGKPLIDQEEEVCTPTSTQNSKTKKDRKSKKSTEKNTNEAVKEGELENGEQPTLPSSEARVESAHHLSAAKSSTIETQLSVQMEEKNGMDRPKKHKKRRRGQDDGLHSIWTKLEAVGGLMMDLDPVFSSDEEYDHHHPSAILTLTAAGIY